MRFSELDDEEDVLRYYAEVFNPLGYFFFLFDEDRDYREKAEHALVASGIISSAFHLVHHLGTGNTAATLPTFSQRFISMKYWTRQMITSPFRRFGPAATRVLGSSATLPLALLFAAMYVGVAVRPGELQTETDRVNRAINTIRGFDGTSWMIEHGHFTDVPYLENPSGDRIWYSFNPQDIDGSHS